jgi:PAS domain S-box-containing protein
VIVSRELLFQQAPISIVQAATDGTILAVNAMVLRVSGYAEQELVGRPFFQFLHPDDRAAARADLARLVEGRARSYESERRYLLKSGDELPVLERVVLVRPDPSAVPYCLSVLHDLTVRHGLIESLSSHEARLRLALEAGQMGTWDVDLLTGETRPSPEVGRIHGVSASQLGGIHDYVQHVRAPGRPRPAAHGDRGRHRERRRA